MDKFLKIIKVLYLYLFNLIIKIFFKIKIFKIIILYLIYLKFKLLKIN